VGQPWCGSSALRAGLELWCCRWSPAAVRRTTVRRKRRGGPVGQDELLERVTDAICEPIADCCSAAGYEMNRDSCVATAGSMVTLATPCADGMTYDSAAAAECIATVEAVLGECRLIYPGDVDACTRVCAGSTAVGAPCESPQECASPPGGVARCMGHPDGDFLCSTLRPAEAGQTCVGFCVESDGVLDCEAVDFSVDGVGASLDYCFRDDGLACIDSVCQPRIAVGQSCRLATDETPGLFDDGCIAEAYCSPATEVCAARVPVGGTCSERSSCATGSYCSADGTCEVQAEYDEPCTDSPTGDNPCRTGYCDGEVGFCRGTPGVLAVSENTCNNVALFF